MMRNPKRTIQATWMAMLALQTIGSIDAQHKLPAPRQYVAIGTLWGVLFLASDTGWDRLAARFSVLLLIAASVLGPFGARLVTFLDSVSHTFAIPPTAAGAGSQGIPPSGDYPAPSPYTPTL